MHIFAWHGRPVRRLHDLSQAYETHRRPGGHCQRNTQTNCLRVWATLRQHQCNTVRSKALHKLSTSYGTGLVVACLVNSPTTLHCFDSAHLYCTKAHKDLHNPGCHAKHTQLSALLKALLTQHTACSACPGMLLTSVLHTGHQQPPDPSTNSRTEQIRLQLHVMLQMHP